jgi:hypothetical protein
MELEIAASSHTEAAFSKTDREIIGLTRRLKEAQKVSNIAPSLKSVEQFGNINKAVKTLGVNLDKGLNSKLKEAKRHVEGGTFNKWASDLNAGLNKLDSTLGSVTGGQVKLKKAAVDMLKAQRAAQVMVNRAHGAEVDLLEQIGDKESELAVARTREHRRRLSAQLEIAKAREVEERKAGRSARTGYVDASVFRNGRLRMGIRRRSEAKEQRDSDAAMRSGFTGYRTSARIKRTTESAQRRQDALAKRQEDLALSKGFTAFRSKNRIRRGTEAAEKRAAAAKDKATYGPLNRQMRIMERSERLERMRVRSEEAAAKRRAAEEKIKANARERLYNAAKGKAWGSAKSAGKHIRHGIHSMSHPFFTSPAFLAMASMTTALLELSRVMKSTLTQDTAKTKYEMFGFKQGTPRSVISADSNELNRGAMNASLKYGVDADHLIDIVSESIRSGVPEAMSKDMMDMIPKAAGAMGEDSEKLAHNMAEAIQQLVSTKEITNADGIRKFLNVDAGMSNYGGMTAQKSDEFLAAGGIGRGKELGLDQYDTMGLAALFGGKGARTGQYDARILGQISEVAPNLEGKYFSALNSYDPITNPQGAALANAPKDLGYDNIQAMTQALKSGAAGIIDFFGRVGKLGPDKAKLIMQGAGFGEGAGAAAAEIAADPEGSKKYIEKARELSKQADGQDYLTEKWEIWSKSMSVMLGRLEAGMKVIDYQIGEPIKDLVLAPISEAWTQITASLTSDDVRGKVREAVQAFIDGLGIRDIKKAILDLAEGFKGHAVADFLRGVGEGIRSLFDDMHWAFDMIAKLSGSGDAETMGRWATEILGLSAALHLLSPVIGIMSAVTNGLLLIKDVFTGIKALGAIAGLTEAAGTAGGAAAGAGGFAALGAGIAAAIAAAPITIGAVAAAAVIGVTVMNWEGIKEFFGFGAPSPMAEGTIRGTGGRPDTVIRNDLLKQVPPSRRDQPETWHEFLSPEQMRQLQQGPQMPQPGFFETARRVMHFADGGLISGPGGGRSDSIVARVSNGEFVVNAAATARNLPVLEALNAGRPIPLFATGGAVGDASSFRPGAMSRQEYLPSGAGLAIKDATVGTERAVRDLKIELQAIRMLLQTASLGGAGGDAGSGGGGGGDERPNLRHGRVGGAIGGGTPNMRYGHGGSTPGTGDAREIGPKVSLGKMGSKFAAKAPVIMDGLMKKYGLTREQAAGVVGNLGHESAGFTAYHEGGQASAKGGVGWAQWTGPRRRAFESWTKAHNLNPTSDEASWRYLTEGDPETARAILAVKGQTTRKGAVRAWEQSFERAGVKNYASRDKFADTAFAGTPGGATVDNSAPSGVSPGGSGRQGDAVDSAMGMMGYNERQAATSLKHIMHAGEWCADFVNGTLAKSGIKGSGSAMARSFSGWGQHVDNKDVQKGDVIEESHGDHVGHVGFATGKTKTDKDGNITAVQMVSGNYGDKVSMNWEKVGMIADLRRSNEAVTAAAKQVTAKVPKSLGDAKTPEEIAKRVPTSDRPTAHRDAENGAGDSPDAGGSAGGGSAATKEVHHHHHLNFYSQVSDPDQHARSVGREMDRHMSTRVHDVDHDVG